MTTEIIALVQKYHSLGWNVIPLRGKQPFTPGWQKQLFDQAKLLDLLQQGKVSNIGVTTGVLSGGLLALDVDQPGVAGYSPEPAIKRGALAHTTSKGVRLIFRTENPRLLNFNSKVIIKKNELTEEQKSRLIGDNGAKELTLVELLGNGRQFVAPPSEHPDTGTKYEWVAPLPDSADSILCINSFDELNELLGQLFSEKWVVDRLLAKAEEDFERVAGSNRWERRFEELKSKLPGLEELIDLSQMKKSGDELYGPHPVHGSSGGKNFWINTKKQVWHCFRHGTGGDVFYFLAMLHGVLDCEECRPGSLRGENFRQVVGILKKEYGVDIYKNYAPPRYLVDYTGVYKVKYNQQGEKELKPVCYTPLHVTGRGYNIDSGEVYLKLEWLDIKGLEHEDFFPQGKLYTKRGLLELLPARGVEVNENCARELIDYLTKCVSSLNDRLETYIVTEKQGWKDKGFVLGNVLYTRKKKEEVLLLAQTERLRGIHSKGTLEGWFVAAEGLLKYDRARFKAYGSASAPLLRLLDVKSYIIDDYGETSTGKTTTSEFAMSIWGNPYQLELTANATKVGLERMAATFCDLPIFLDETSLIDRKILQEFVYMLANETGRIRGAKTGGLQETDTWKTVVFATGEAPIKGGSSFGGLSGRVIELYGGLGANDLDAIERFKDNITENYGVVGPLLIEKILSYERAELIESFRKIRAELRRKVKGRIEARLSNTFAAIACGGVLFEEILEEHGLPTRNPLEVVLKVYNEVVKDVSDTGYLDRYLANLRGWVAANRGLFIDELATVEEEDGEGAKKPNWHEKYGRIDDKHVDIFPHILKKITENFGFNYDRVLKDLKEGEITITNNGRQYNTRINGENVTVVRFLKDKLFAEADK